MDLKYTPDEDAFRAEVRSFIDAETAAGHQQQDPLGDGVCTKTTSCAGNKSCIVTAGVP